MLSHTDEWIAASVELGWPVQLQPSMKRQTVMSSQPYYNTVVCDLHVILMVTDVVSLQLEQLEQDSFAR